MAKPIPKRATYDDVLNAPSHVVAELIDGVLAQSPRPMPPHAAAANLLAFEITGPFQKGRGGPGGWIFAFEPELHLGANVLVPDLAGWRRERLPVIPLDEHISVAPDWVCEILSPSTANLDRNAKRRAYGEAGVAFLWLLDPRSRSLEAFQLVAGKWMLVGVVTDDEPVSLPPFDAISFPLSDLFPFDPPAGGDVSIKG
jgi:Uma2 family endonuclease